MTHHFQDLLPTTLPDEDWARAQWLRWESQNRYAVTPVKKCHSTGTWPQDPREHYAVLFPKREIGEFLEFIAYEFFHASILQDLAGSGTADGSWFCLESIDAYTDRLLGFLRVQESAKSPDDIRRWLRLWELPDSLRWICELEHYGGLFRDDESDSTLWSETATGYLVFLVING